MKRLWTILAFVAMCLAMGGVAGADLLNMVNNPGFETADFTGWTADWPTVDTTYNGISNLYPHSGTWCAYLGSVDSLGHLSQTLATTPGDTYQISFCLLSDGQTPNEFVATWGGATMYDEVNISSSLPSYTQHQFTEVASGASTDLTFGFRDDPGDLRLDDISVVNTVPLPGAFLLLGSGLLGLAGWRRLRKG